MPTPNGWRASWHGLAGCRGDVGYAGLKDRRAVALQWFSRAALARAAASWSALRGEGFEVLEAHAAPRKLPRGALAGNRFAIRLRRHRRGTDAQPAAP